MPLSEEQIKKDFLDYINKNGNVYKSWYVGVSSDPRSRLFNDHCVDEKNDAWIFRQAFSSNAARNVEYHFIHTLGTDGGTGGGDDTADYVYAYKKNAHTNP